MDWLKPAGIYLIIVGMILFLRSGLNIRERHFVELTLMQCVIRHHIPMMLLLCVALLFGLFSGVVYWGVGLLVPLIALGCFFPGLRREYNDLLAVWKRCRKEIVRSAALPVAVAGVIRRLEEESRERNLDTAALYMLLNGYENR